MRPNGAPMALARPARAWLSGLAAFWLASVPVLAGDRAGIEFIGYSPDAAFFAFEEFGIQDGSGFAYSHIFVLDLQADRWVGGTPFRGQADSEDVSLATMRARVAEDAAGTLAQLAIAEPVQIAALLGDGVPDKAGKGMVFGAPSYKAGEIAEEYQLVLSQFPAKAPSPCTEWFGAEPLGYALRLEGGGQTRELHRDEALPGSRGCPLDYRIYGVVLPFGASEIEDGVAILSVYPGGFEGPDRRFIAVPLGP